LKNDGWGDMLYFFYQPYLGLGRLIVEVSRSHSIRHTDLEATYDLCLIL